MFTAELSLELLSLPGSAATTPPAELSTRPDPPAVLSCYAWSVQTVGRSLCALAVS